MPASPGYRTHDYVGLYFIKSIRYIGKFKKDVAVNPQNGELVGETEDLTEEERERILEAMWPAIEQDHRFLMIEDLSD